MSPAGEALELRWHAFGELGADGIYEILALRERVFVVEQHCAYQEADGLDPGALHLCGRGEDGTLAAYLRLLPPGAAAPGPAIGRVLTRPELRGRGVARRLMEEGILEAERRYGGAAITVHAQTHLEPFYASLGFVVSGAPHEEEGILHTLMVRPSPAR